MTYINLSFFSGCCLLAFFLGGCASQDVSSSAQDDYDTATRREKRAMDNGKFFGEETFSLGDGTTRQKDKGQGLGVNRYLWRSSLEVLSFMPLASTDPFGGVILTDWYHPQGSQERLKVNVHILEGRLRADALSITVFKQNLVKGQWVDAPVDSKTARDLENAVLTKARQLRIETGV